MQIVDYKTGHGKAKPTEVNDFQAPYLHFLPGSSFLGGVDAESAIWNDSRPTHRSIVFRSSASTSGSHPEGIIYVPTKATERLKDAKQEIERLAQTAGEDNWDGEGADKLSDNAMRVALKLVGAFPPDVWNVDWEDDLDIDVTAHGSIDIGWVLERDVMMNVLVHASGEIGFVYSVRGEEDHGRELWKGELPACIEEAFDKVFYQRRLDG